MNNISIIGIIDMNIEKINNNTMKDNYFIRFDTDKLPFDFDKWIQIDIKKMDEKFISVRDKNVFLKIKKYSFVVIESYDEDFMIEIGGLLSKIEKGRKYLPIMSEYHDTYIKLSPNLSIYVNSKYNDDSHDINSDYFFMFSCSHHVIFDNLKLFNDCSNDSYSLLIYSMGMYGYISNYRLSYFNKHDIVDLNKFYYEYENLNASSNYMEMINYIDNFFQYEIIKIFK